jgi:branched-chain amino acid transport system substrate-binding protein
MCALLVGGVLVAAVAVGGYLLTLRDGKTALTDGLGPAMDPCAQDTFGCVEIAAREPIKIGTLLLHDLGSETGILLAMDFRKTPGEIAGHPVEFAPQDDGCSPEGGRAGAKALGADPDIVGVIGTSCSSSALGVADKILSQKGIVLISPSNTGPAVTDPATHQPFYLRTSWNDKLQGVAMARFAFEEARARTASTIHDGTPYAEGLQQVFADAFTTLGGTVVRQEAIQPGDSDFKPLLKDIAADSIDYLYYPIFIPEGGLITAQARRIPSLSDTNLAGADGLFTRDWIEAAGAGRAEGVYVSHARLTPFDKDFYEQEYLPAHEEKFGKPLTEFHAYAFDAMNLLADAIEAVAIRGGGGALRIPRTALKDELFATEGFEGITGLLTCNTYGDCQQQHTMAIHQVSNGRFGEPIRTYTITLEEAGP